MNGTCEFNGSRARLRASARSAACCSFLRASARLRAAASLLGDRGLLLRAQLRAPPHPARPADRRPRHRSPGQDPPRPLSSPRDPPRPLSSPRDPPRLHRPEPAEPRSRRSRRSPGSRAGFGRDRQIGARRRAGSRRLRGLYLLPRRGRLLGRDQRLVLLRGEHDLLAVRYPPPHRRTVLRDHAIIVGDRRIGPRRRRREIYIGRLVRRDDQPLARAREAAGRERVKALVAALAPIVDARRHHRALPDPQITQPRRGQVGQRIHRHHLVARDRVHRELVSPGRRQRRPDLPEVHGRLARREHRLRVRGWHDHGHRLVDNRHRRRRRLWRRPGCSDLGQRPRRLRTRTAAALREQEDEHERGGAA